jgi:hypothetical protein
MTLSPFTLVPFSKLVFAFAAVIAVVFVNWQQLAISLPSNDSAIVFNNLVRSSNFSLILLK